MATVTNWCPNPSFEGSTPLGGWTEYNKSAGLVSYIDTSNKKFGTQSMRVDMGSSGDYGRSISFTLPAGTYYPAAWAQTLTGLTNACFVVRRSSDLNVYVEQHWTTVNGTWTQKSGSFTLTTSTQVDVVVGIGSYGAASAGSARFDGIMVLDAAGTVYFDGSSTDSTGATVYAWTGGANNSPSTATPAGSTGGGSTGGGSTGGGSTGGGVPVATQGWTLAQTNPFTSQTSVDASRFYVYNNFAGTNNTGTYKSTRTTVTGGVLTLAPYQDEVAGLVTQLRPLTYAAYDVYVKVTPVKGYKPVIFLWPDARPDPDGVSREHWSDGEIDFFECTDSTGTTFQIFFHQPGNPTNNSKQTRVPINIAGVFNKVRVEWLPNRVTIFVNDTQVYEVTDPTWIPTVPMHLVVQYDVGAPGSSNGVSVRDGYPAASSVQPKMEITQIDIWTPSSGWYGYGAPPNGTLADARSKARAIYDEFMSYCYTTSGIPSALPAGSARIARPDQGNDTVSEGMGYGMLGCVGYGNATLDVYDSTARTKFDALWTYAKYFRNANGLMNWDVSSTGTLLGTGGATDGDQDMALALVLADRLGWSTSSRPYGAEATVLINAIGATEYVPATGHANPNIQTNGDQWGVDTNDDMPDYFAPAWMRIFYEHTGDSAWLTRITANYALQRTYFDTHYSTGMVPDECDRSGAAITGKSFKWSYNAVRSPWRSVCDFLWYGGVAPSVAHGQATKLAAFGKTQSSNTPANLKAEYNLDGTGYASYTNMAFVQAFGVASVADAANSQFAQDCLAYLYSNRVTGASYFSLGTAMVSSMVMAGILQPLAETAPGKTLFATMGGAGAMTGLVQIPQRLAATMSGAGAMTGVIGIPKTMAATMRGSGFTFPSLKAGSTPATQGLAAVLGGEGVLSSALFRSTQVLKAFMGGQSAFLADLATAQDLTVCGHL